MFFKNIIKEFRDFAIRGNVLDMAVGIIIGTAFNKIVSSLINDIIMPPFGLLLGKVDFSNLFINLSGTPYTSLAEAKAAGAPTINYGVFINHLIHFFIVSFVMFLFVRQINRFRRKKEEEKPKTKTCPFCCSTIPVNAKRCPYCTSNLEA